MEGVGRHLGGCIGKFPDSVDKEIDSYKINTHWEATQKVMAAKLKWQRAVPFAVLAPGGKSVNFWIHHRISRQYTARKRERDLLWTD
jgi:uncharacterized membrane protein